jgi:hypothetical protein
MKNYIVEWFPEKKIKNYRICFKNNKRLFFFGLFCALSSFLYGILPLLGVGIISAGMWFNISINLILLIYYRWGLFAIKKNDLGNGVPEKW